MLTRTDSNTVGEACKSFALPPDLSAALLHWSGVIRTGFAHGTDRQERRAPMLEADEALPIAAAPTPQAALSGAERSDLASNESGQLALFPPVKGRRGRPRKPDVIKQRALQTTSTALFDETCRAIAALDRRTLAAAKCAVRDKAARDARRLTPGANKILVYILDRLNPQRGMDWHGQAAIAQATGLAQRTVGDGIRRLVLCGYLTRRAVPIGRRHASWLWLTTVPCVIDAARDLPAQKRAGAGNDQQKKCERPAEEMPEEPADSCRVVCSTNPSSESVPTGTAAEGRNETATLICDAIGGTGPGFSMKGLIRSRIRQAQGITHMPGSGHLRRVERRLERRGGDPARFTAEFVASAPHFDSAHDAANGLEEFYARYVGRGHSATLASAAPHWRALE